MIRVALNLLSLMLVICFTTILHAKTLDQKKDELKKIYEAGGISKVEYEKGKEFLENLENKDKKKKQKQQFSLGHKKKKNLKFNLPKKKVEDLEKITLEKIKELGKPVKLDDSYFTKGMMKKFKGCNNSFKCKGDKAGQILFKTFTSSKSFGQKNPGKMIKAMAMYEVFYAKKLWYARKSLARYKEDNYKKIDYKRKKDENEIRSLFGINKGRKNMREALAMSFDTPTKEAIKKFWLLGEFLDLGTGVENEKLDKDLKERQKLLEAYKLQIANLKKKLQDDIEEKEDEKSVE
tara:strand:- start:6406 stop:7281 length:876 start_codon:yes stop_codon:yes gene_type:complete